MPRLKAQQLRRKDMGQKATGSREKSPAGDVTRTVQTLGIGPEHAPTSTGGTFLMRTTYAFLLSVIFGVAFAVAQNTGSSGSAVSPSAPSSQSQTTGPMGSQPGQGDLSNQPGTSQNPSAQGQVGNPDLAQPGVANPSNDTALGPSGQGTTTNANRNRSSAWVWVIVGLIVLGLIIYFAARGTSDTTSRIERSEQDRDKDQTRRAA